MTKQPIVLYDRVAILAHRDELPGDTTDAERQAVALYRKLRAAGARPAQIKSEVEAIGAAKKKTKAARRSR